VPRSGRGASGPDRDCGNQARFAPADDGAAPVFFRVIFVTGLASVPTAVADLDLVRGAARSVALALALALAIILAGVASLYRPRPVWGGRAVPRAPFAAPPAEAPPAAPPATVAMGSAGSAEPGVAAAAEEGPLPPSAPSPEPPPSSVVGRGAGL
jgi:hypothetical protein